MMFLHHKNDVLTLFTRTGLFAMLLIGTMVIIDKYSSYPGVVSGRPNKKKVWIGGLLISAG
jgi:hypothetical protein